MSLEKLPTEILHKICQDVAIIGSPKLVGLTRASRRLHAVSNPILYATDLQESGGVISICFGLASRQHSVVKLCLAAGVKPDLRVESPHDLESIFLSRVHKNGAMNFYRWFRERVDLRRNGRRSSEYALHLLPGWVPPYDNIRRDGNKPFRSYQTFYWTPLHVAALLNDVELLAILLDYGVNPNCAGRGVCPCYYQRLRRTLDRSLTTEGQDPVEMLERRVVTRWSPLHVAVCKGNFECAEYLISRFGLPQAKESDDDVMAEARQFFRTEPMLANMVRFDPDFIGRVTPRFDPLPPLHVAADKYASLKEFERLYDMLERSGCLEGPHSNVDVLDAFGDTPFAVATCSGRTETFGTWLRDRGADVNFALLGQDGVRRSILNVLCKSGEHGDALSLMDLGGVNINRDKELRRGLRHESALHLCCGWRGLTDAWPGEGKIQKQREAATLLKRLVRAGADVDARAEDGTTPLMSAAALHFPAAVRGLLEGKADVGAEDDDGQSALHKAVASGVSCFPGAALSAALATIQILLDNGADPNQQHADRSGPPLFQGYYETGETPGADPWEFTSDPTRDGEPSAMASIASLLIKRGADPNIYLDYPRGRGDNLQEKIDNLGGRSLAVTAFFKGEFDALDSLVACGTLITLQDYLLMMQSLLDEYFRSMGSKSNAVQSLFRILNGPSLHLEQPGDRKIIMDSWTKFLFVSVENRPGLVSVLAPHFSVTDRFEFGGRNILHCLGHLFPKKSESKADFRRRIKGLMADLIRCGAGRHLNHPDDNAETPLYFAVAHRNNLPVAKALVRAGASLYCEPARPSGSRVPSPVRVAIWGCSSATGFKVADGMLDAFHSKWHRSIDSYCGNAGLLKDLIVQFRDRRFDDRVRTAARTNKLMVKLIDLGVDVNESDEDGNTPLHLLIQLLYPPDKNSKGIRTSYTFNELDIPKETHIFEQGNNHIYPSDSDFEGEGSDEESTHNSVPFWEPMGQDDSSSEHGSSDDEEHTDDESKGRDDGDDHSLHGDLLQSNSLRVMTRKGYQGDIPKREPSGLAKRARARKLDRADSWILSFYILLCESKDVSLKMKNSAGKTPLDLMHGLKACRIKECPKAYRRIINPLSKFDPSDPLSSELLNKLTGSSVLPKKGRPFFFIYNRNGCYLVVPHREGERRVERRDRSGDQWSWVPFW